MQQPPTVTTNVASGVTTTTATLNGTINPNGSTTTGWFLWGTSNPPTTQSSVQTIGSGTSPVTMTPVSLSSLTPNTTYYFRAVGQGAGNTIVYGTVLSFATGAQPPTVTTNVASGVTTTTATLNGTINPNGSTTTGWFLWGTSNPPTTQSSVQTIGSGTSPVTMTPVSLSSLTPNTTYYFRAVGQGAGNTIVYGTVLSFATGACTSTPITQGQTVSGSLDDSDCTAPHGSAKADLYTFTGNAGQVVSIAMNRTSLGDPFLILVGPDGTVVAHDDDSGGNLNSLISNFTLPNSGTYTIEATAWASTNRGTYTLTLTSLLTLTVTKAGTGSGTVTSNPAGINCGTDCTESYSSGTIVTLTATPASGSTFAGWSGDADCSNGQVTMTISKTCTATFTTTSTGALQVTVRRSDTQAALPGALVTVSSPGTLVSQTTGSSGVTTFFNLQAGSYSVTVGLTGFQTGSTTATVNANTTTAASISLTPDIITGSLRITVRRSDTQAALPDALVTVSSPGTLQSQMTGSNGSTTFSNLQAGSYSLTVSLTGFQTGSTTATVSANLTTSTSISLTPITLTGTWSGWSQVPGGGQTGSHPAVVLDSTGTLRLYIQGIDNGLWAKQKSGGSWSDWSRVAGGGSLDGPAAFLDGTAVRLVVRGLDNSLWTALADTPTWQHLGGRTERSPAAVVHVGSPSIFIRGLDGRLYEMLRDQTGVWSQWAEVPGSGQSSGQPAAVVDSTGTLHLYIQGIDNSLWTNQVSPTLAWGQWTAGVGGRSSVGPAAILDGDKVRLIIRGLDNRIWTTLASDAQATQWGSWEDLGGQTLNPPAAVRDGNTLHFFIRGIDGRLYMNSRTGGSGASESEQSEE